MSTPGATKSLVHVTRGFFPRQTQKVASGERRISKPIFQHVGVIETKGHRAANGRWIQARGVLSKPPRSKYQPGIPHDHGWTHPKDRIAQWSIVKGDRVRLLTGKDKYKYNDENEGVASGWKIWEVKRIDMRKNRVYLDGMVQKKSSQGSPQPADWETMTKDEQQDWAGKNNIKDAEKSVQVSNLSLLVEENKEDPTKHIFAKRLKTTSAKYSAELKLWVWKRYAVALTGQPINPDLKQGEKGWLIPWPGPVRGKSEKRSTSGSVYEGGESMVEPITYKSIDLDEVLQTSYRTSIADLIPATTRGRPTTTQYYADLYRSYNHIAEAELYPLIDNLMPLYLSEELAPRFAKHKIRLDWQAKQEALVREREAYVQEAVREWELNGRDRGLREIMDSSLANLAGVPLKYRTKKEVEDVARMEFDEMKENEKIDVARKYKYGWIHDATGGWIQGPRAIKVMEKKERRKARNMKKLDTLATLTLKPGKNQFVPPEIRKEIEASL